MIRVQQEDFDVGAEIATLKAGRSDIGAFVAFIGTVRDQAGAVEEMTLEHYPGMTEAELERIEKEACARWPLQASLIVHRYGTLGHDPEPVFSLLLKYAVSEDGALHAEKYYRTVREEFTSTRPAFRWRQLVALARVTASECGRPAPGYREACELLKV